MSPTILFCIMSTIVIFYSLAISCFVANAKENDSEFIKMEATAYCTGKVRCDQGYVREGICATDAKHYGMIACIYDMNADGTVGDFIGYYECLDTGGESIKNGDVIDIYNPSYDWCIEFGSRDVLVKFIDGNG